MKNRIYYFTDTGNSMRAAISAKTPVVKIMGLPKNASCTETHPLHPQI